MSPQENRFGRRRGRGIRPWLLAVKMIGLFGFLGGLASLAALALGGPTPDDPESWILVRDMLRAVFFPTVFCGLMLAMAAGLALWLQMPRVFLRMRWFRLKALGLTILLPALHFGSRGRVQAFYAAVDAEDLDALPALWRQVGTAFAVAFVLMLALSIYSRIKPRLGQPLRPTRDSSRPANEAEID